MQLHTNVTIGNVNPKLDTFDDIKELTKAGGLNKINAIRVFYTDKYVRGFEIFYKLNAGDMMLAGHNVPKKRKELQHTIFEIGPDDYISEILGSFENGKKSKIINITFITYRGKAQTFGGKGPQTFKFCTPGFTFGAFKGGFKKQIEWLVIEVLPLPQQFKTEMEKLGILKIQTINVNIQTPSQPIHQVYQPKIQVAKPLIVTPNIGVAPQIIAPKPVINQVSNSGLTNSQYPVFNQQPPIYPQYPGQPQPYNPYKNQ